MILIHRSKAPYNMGTLLWQLNDCWPVASWSITDYYNTAPKAAWYAVKEAYKDQVNIARDTIRPKDLKLSNPKLTYQIKGNQLLIQSTSFAKYVFIDVDGYTEPLSDNYFDLAPGKVKAITFNDKLLKGKPFKVKVKSLWDVIGKNSRRP
eukprot:GDKJ01047708.1.p1 GENE.GDKJ01047708.1~~GDKJ01047708.1.p1  ORF type:complete len:159 (+),score=3.28 GDKJ01047708.1:29-478(+)